MSEGPTAQSQPRREEVNSEGPTVKGPQRRANSEASTAKRQQQRGNIGWPTTKGKQRMANSKSRANRQGTNSQGPTANNSMGPTAKGRHLSTNSLEPNCQQQLIKQHLITTNKAVIIINIQFIEYKEVVNTIFFTKSIVTPIQIRCI